MSVNAYRLYCFKDKVEHMSWAEYRTNGEALLFNRYVASWETFDYSHEFETVGPNFIRFSDEMSNKNGVE